MFIDASLCAEVAPLLDFVVRRRGEVDGVTTSAALLRLAQQTERFWPGPSSRSTPPLPQPDARERERISATEAATRLGITRVRIGQRCRRGDFATARQDDRGWWTIEVAEVEQFAGVGSGSQVPPPDPGGGGGPNGAGLVVRSPGG